MLSNDKLAVQMGAVRDQMLAVITAHEREEHGGLPCFGNRSNAIAFLAHSLGLDPEAWKDAGTLLRRYDAECVQQNLDKEGWSPP